MTMDLKGPPQTSLAMDAGAVADPSSGRSAFALARLPRIMFGAGKSGELPEIVLSYGPRALVIVRGRGFTATPDWARIGTALFAAGVDLVVAEVDGEPSPAQIDEIVAGVRGGSAGSAVAPVDVVVGIGGGSVLDTAKAVAGLLIPGNSVMDHLEGVGPQLPYRGPSVPFFAVPTTAGTGSEATKNAVLSTHGEGAFKKSFRDEALVAAVAIVDPDLLAGCPPDLISSNGMDAVTQLIESYVSLRANPITDALALSGLAAARDGLLAWYEEAFSGPGGAGAGGAGTGHDGADTGHDGAGAPSSPVAIARERMAYAALCSGICLANAGLGAVHGLASPLGAQFPIPHGAACGSVLAATTRVNIRALESRAPESPALRRYADVGRVLAAGGTGGASGAAGATGAAGAAASAMSDVEARAALVSLLDNWRATLVVPWLSSFGIRESMIHGIILDSRGSSMKTNPIVLTDEELAVILRVSL